MEAPNGEDTVALLLDARLASVYPVSQLFIDSAAVAEADFVRDKHLGNGKFGVAWCVASSPGALLAPPTAHRSVRRPSFRPFPRQARNACADGHGVRAEGGRQGRHY